MKGKDFFDMTVGIAAVLLSVLLFSCSSDDSLEHVAYGLADNICFGVSDLDNGTRANTIDNDVIANRYVLRTADGSDTLCVRAVVSDGIYYSEAMSLGTRANMQTNMYDNFKVVAQLKNTNGTLGSQYYMNETATKNNAVWQPSSIYYWPGQRQLCFLAWAPCEDGIFSESPIFPTVDVNKTSLRYTTPDDVSKHRDLLVAYTGFMDNPSSGTTCTPVTLHFQHICAAVVIKTGKDIAPGTIKSVKITNVRNSGTYDMATSKWNLNSQTTNYYVEPYLATSYNTPNGTTVTGEDATFLLLPQTLGSNSKLEVVFHDDIYNKDRTLTASLSGAEWPMGKTVTYRLSITPEYELNFTSEPEVQDAHYVIYPINIKVDNKLPYGWTLTSRSSHVTLCKELTDLTKMGYWIEEDRGKTSIDGTEKGNITVYAFLDENATDAEREMVLELKPKGFGSVIPALFTIRQMCPSWNGSGLGCERIEDGNCQWGFKWDSSMDVTYDMSKSGGNDILRPYRRWLMYRQIAHFADQYPFLSYTEWFSQLQSVTFEFSKIPPLDVATSVSDGKQNTIDLYDFNSLGDVIGLVQKLEEWGGVPNKTLPKNLSKYAARICALKNKFNKKKIDQGTLGVAYVPVLKPENVVWHLPAKDEAPTMVDADKPLAGDYWTSTVTDVADDKDHAYKYTVGAGVSLAKRNLELHVRAVRKRE